MSELLSNQPIELSEKTDLIGTLDKADTISFFLSNNLKSFDEIKMIALYGGWGSGKTSIMSRIQSNLPEKKFKSIFFEAWKHEKDNNIALSLVSLFNEELEDLPTIKELTKNSLMIFKGVLKGVEFSTPSFPGLPTVKISPKETLESIEKDIEALTSASFFDVEKEFKTAFQEAEKKIAKTHGLDDDGKIVVFIDDLDRCEPENVIQLLSLIKLFFIYGNRTIFFCGVDKEAVKNAIQTKYNEAIKSEEYLEKIFDCSFNVNSNYNQTKLIEHYFKGNVSFGNTNQKVSSIINSFLGNIEFNTPRHVKKVLNKLLILRSFKNKDFKYSSLIPNLNDDNETENILQIIFTIFIIILYEFKPHLFGELESYYTKIDVYSKLRFDNWPGSNTNLKIENIIINTTSTYFKYDIPTMPLQSIVNKYSSLNQNPSEKDKLFQEFLIIFLPSKNLDRFHDITENTAFVSQFENDKNSILIKFCLYLNDNKKLLFDSPSPGNYKIEDLFKMARMTL